jgi:hypothetical protein
MPLVNVPCPGAGRSFIFQGARQHTAQAGQNIKASLDLTATPRIDQRETDAKLAKAEPGNSRTLSSDPGQISLERPNGSANAICPKSRAQNQRYLTENRAKQLN